jgi:hypothetical protein
LKTTGQTLSSENFKRSEQTKQTKQKENIMKNLSYLELVEEMNSHAYNSRYKEYMETARDFDLSGYSFLVKTLHGLIDHVVNNLKLAKIEIVEHDLDDEDKIDIILDVLNSNAPSFHHWEIDEKVILGENLLDLQIKVDRDFEWLSDLVEPSLEDYMIQPGDYRISNSNKQMVIHIEDGAYPTSAGTRDDINVYKIDKNVVVVSHSNYLPTLGMEVFAETVGLAAPFAECFFQEESVAYHFGDLQDRIIHVVACDLYATLTYGM